MPKPPPIGRFSSEAIDSLLEALKRAEQTPEHFRRVLVQLPLTLAVFLEADHRLEVSTPPAHLLYGCETRARPARECLNDAAIGRGMLTKLDQTYATGSDSLRTTVFVSIPVASAAG